MKHYDEQPETPATQLARALERANEPSQPGTPRDRANRLLDVGILASAQTVNAMTKLDGDPNAAVRFPHLPIHEIVGRVSPGRLVFVMANTGQGKTTFMLDLLDRWASQGLQVDYVGTEQEPDELRTKWACLRADVPAHVAINLEWDEHPEGRIWQHSVKTELEAIEIAFGSRVVFHPDKFINLAKIERAAKDANVRGANVLIVDHIDRVETEATDNEYLAMKRIIRRLKELARDYRLVLVVASQVNREGRKGDRIAVYRPPRLETMQGGAAKEQEADVVLGLWRPIRQRHPEESPDDYKNIIAAATRGDVEPREFVEPNTMAVVCLKHRTRNTEGNRCKLHVHHGRLSEIAERDQYTTAHGQPRKVL